MKKLFILLCALTGVLNTYAYPIEINDTTLMFKETTFWDIDCIIGIGNYKDSTKYTTYIVDGPLTSAAVSKISYYFDSLVVNFDMTSLKITHYEESSSDIIEEHTFPDDVLDKCPNLRVVKFPSNCDTISRAVFGYSNNTVLKKLDSIYITNQNKVVKVLYGNVGLWSALGDTYDARILSGDTIVVMVPRALYSAYKARAIYKGDWFRFKIVAYDVPKPQTGTTNITNKSSIITITKDVININDVESGQSGQILIFDLKGNLMLRSEIKPQIDISTLPKGIYVVNINNKYGSKFIKE